MIIWLVVIIFSLLLAAVGLTIAILDLMACYKALNTVRKRNRTMEPGMVFLIFVPFLNIVWAFLNVMRVAESLRSEFEDRGWNTDDESFGYGSGLTAAILNLIPCAAPIGLVFLYMHWRQVSAYTEQLLVNKRPR